MGQCPHARVLFKSDKKLPQVYRGEAARRGYLSLTTRRIKSDKKLPQVYRGVVAYSVAIR